MGSSSRDPLLDAALQYWDHILMMYREFARLKPIILFDIQEQRIYAYPYQEFKDELRASNQASLEAQYTSAIAMSKFVLFVRDNVERRLVSYSLSCEEPVETESDESNGSHRGIVGM